MLDKQALAELLSPIVVKEMYIGGKPMEAIPPITFKVTFDGHIASAETDFRQLVAYVHTYQTSDAYIKDDLTTAAYDAVAREYMAHATDEEVKARLKPKISVPRNRQTRKYVYVVTRSEAYGKVSVGSIQPTPDSAIAVGFRWYRADHRADPPAYDDNYRIDAYEMEAFYGLTDRPEALVKESAAITAKLRAVTAKYREAKRKEAQHA
jgi:hypothetical protein